ncbi:type I methionyl aminopeptidase [Colwellia sp. 4_MG-2023]|jgi:methionyl aminopeptidase|uniref:type I methionyl aminopeptidase n=1 Tax=unclassified Colwellia TaxID=196834 RepID=UPI001C09D548|nr:MULTISPECIES: type I methionyl aminopeptidase [unclassified Colwellia]MBU2925677.1 type I methionyl aminopeptidase [Colwellia sp. C2M11]MDO6487840.1 type I methionyl aminopeptidase [Colwellia sp. 6_MG-2023]MDO6507475.1 type I methionyl aminopeptidase [Colwellia sp. 5_MG-2023]MDO6556267.1 type I methionyl aminopeptidase [Colwellia sp. 4_MG-2023]MDO6651097.1 type I methionyl aminopeptidase [Colwellia sp. 3_MG-2023]
MTIPIKSQDEIAKMRIAGQLACDVLEMIAPHVKAGVTTNELDALCAEYTEKVQQAISAPLNYHNFPKSICTSINHVVCHGIPDNTVLKDGDIINLDITVIKDGYHGDTSKMFLIGEVSPENSRLCRLAQEALYIGLKKVKPGATFGEIGTAIQKFIKSKGRYSIVKDYCGHGIGVEFHEEPQIVHYKNNDKTKMQEGMCFTIEPMINLGKATTVLDKDDNWTVYTSDSKNSAQWEHTLVVTKTGCEILTLRKEESISRILHN